MVLKQWKETTILQNPASWRRYWAGTLVSKVILGGRSGGGGKLPIKLIKILLPHEAPLILFKTIPLQISFCIVSKMEIQHQQPFFALKFVGFCLVKTWIIWSQAEFSLLGCDSALALWFTDHYWFVPNLSAGQNIGSPCSFHCSGWKGEFQPVARQEQEGWKPLL